MVRSTSLQNEPVRVAMWSGPRNISTALLRSWGNRPDTVVCDEPFYAYYLRETRLPHPGAEEVIAQHESDPEKVIAWLTGPIPGGKTIFYQKQMAHHLLPAIRLDWLETLHNCFLIREPREMITSLIKVTPEPQLSDTGLPQQVKLWRHLRDRSGNVPLVIDSADVLRDPPTMLRRLCRRIGVAFREEMLAWPRGRRATDGVWAKHWYAAVVNSTGFATYRPKDETFPARFKRLLVECQTLYDELAAHRLGSFEK